MALPHAAERTAPHFGGISFPPIQVIALALLVVLAISLTYVALTPRSGVSGHREQANASALRWDLERIQQIGYINQAARSARNWELQRRQQVPYVDPGLRSAQDWEVQRRQQAAGALS